MDVIELARELGKAIQQDERFLAMQIEPELRETYAKVMQNKNMNAYNEAKELMDNMLKRINAIISISAEGGDPEIADLTEDTCGGSCSSCAGCH